MTPLQPRSDQIYLVTGANGYIAAHVCDQLLKLGYNVRGSVRNAAKNDWLQVHFVAHYGQNRFELVEVPDLGVEGCFEQHLRDCTGFINVAGDVSFVDDPEKVIPPALASIRNALTACDVEAAREGSRFRRFTFLSSSHAVRTRKTGQRQRITTDSWNNEAVQKVENYKNAAQASQASGVKSIYDSIAIDIYSVAKVVTEREVWGHARDVNCRYVVNTLVPNFNIGGTLHPRQVEQPGKPIFVMKQMFTGLLAGDQAYVDTVIPPQRFTSVQDTGILLAALATDAEIKNERVLAMATPFNGRQIIETLRRLRPQNREYLQRLTAQDVNDLSEIDCSLAQGILRKYKQNTTGFDTLDVAVESTLASLGL